jgi:hypothetical protein
MTLLSLEAEYMAISEITKDILFVKQILEFLRTTINYPIMVKIDNIGAIYMAKNETSNHQTKHINTHYHFVKELIDVGFIKVELVRSKNNDSNIVMNNLGCKLFKKHSKTFMVEKNKNVDSLMKQKGCWKVSYGPPVFSM